MQISEYIQIACAIVGIGLIAWVRVSFQKRLQQDPFVNAYSKVENVVRIVAFAIIAFGLVLVFFPFG